MKIFVFENIIGNYCSGDYYFVAESLDEANLMAHNYAVIHNDKVRLNQNYIIEFVIDEAEEYDIQSGYLPLNRVDINVIK